MEKGHFVTVIITAYNSENYIKRSISSVLDQTYTDFDLIVVNYANTDMVGHTGDMNAAIKAVETVDTCVGRVFDAVEACGGGMIITADHGNCEQMHNPAKGEKHTAHTLNVVPLLIAGAAFKGKKQRDTREGSLADIAPTALDIMGLDKPKIMTGRSHVETTA